MKRLIALGVLILLAIGIFTLFNHKHGDNNTQPTQPTIYAKTDAIPPPSRAELLAETNNARIQNGEPALPEDSRLDTSAQEKADDENTNHYVSHVNPTTGMHGYEYLHAAYPQCYQGAENLTENIYVNDTSHAVNAWLNSPPHRAQLLSSRDISVGFGISGDEIVAHYCMTV